MTRFRRLCLITAAVTLAGAASAGAAALVVSRAVDPSVRPAPVSAGGPLWAVPAPEPATTSSVPATPRPVASAAAPAPAPAPVPVPATPVGRLGAALDSALTNTNSCLEVRDVNGAVLYRRATTVPLTPASTQKLLVAAAALDILGPGYRFVTSVVAARAPRAGAVDDLWLVGGGDPVLASPEFTAFLIAQPITGGNPVTTQMAALANQLAAAGVRAVPGGIHGDDARYDRQRFLPTWKPLYVQEADVAPLGALEVDGGLDRWHPAVLTGDPAAHAAGVLARLAGARGIAAAQGADGTAPAGGVVLAAVQSPPLADIVTEMLRDSDNTTAEMLVREVDHAKGGPGSTAEGVAIVMSEAARLGVPTAGLGLVDGSGLSPENRATCATLFATMDLAGRAPFTSMGLLSVAGKFGTLVHRFVGTPADGHLEAKTGSIDGVAGMVGRLDVRQPLSFAFVLNGPINYPTGVDYENRVVAALAAYPS